MLIQSLYERINLDLLDNYKYQSIIIIVIRED